MLVTATLCSVVVVLIGALVDGLFVKEVDKRAIFENIGPDIPSHVGGLIGWLSGLKVGSHMDEVKNGMA